MVRILQNQRGLKYRDMAILLRKLTEKSQMNFGKYFDCTAGQLLALKHHSYLRWVYYNMSNITFMDNILQEIGIMEEHKITKPGKDSEMGEYLQNLASMKISGITKYRNNKKNKKIKIAKLGMKSRADGVFFSKANLMRRNHGKL